MTNVNIFLKPQFLFKLEYWYRHTQCGLTEKDCDTDTITAESFQDAKEMLLEKHDTPSFRIYQVTELSKTPLVASESNLVNF